MMRAAALVQCLLLTSAFQVANAQDSATLSEKLRMAEEARWVVRVSHVPQSPVIGRLRSAGQEYRVNDLVIDTGRITLLERAEYVSRGTKFIRTAAIAGALIGLGSIVYNNLREINCATPCWVYRVGGGAVLGAIAGLTLSESQRERIWVKEWERAP